LGTLLMLCLQAEALLAEPVVVVGELTGVIDPVSAEYAARVIALAEEQKAEAVVFRIDTPGGLDASMRSIIQAMLDSEVPVVVYVYPRGARAASAGSFVLVASHIAAMAPGTATGAAHPVAIGAGEVSEKVVQDAAAYMRSLAQLRGRNVSLAESFVTGSVSLSAEEAFKAGIADVIASDYGELLEKIDGMRVETAAGTEVLNTAGAALQWEPMSARDRLLHRLSDPNIAYILFLIGMYGIILELSNPGAVLPGVAGTIALLLALWSFQALSMSLAGLALILLALLLFIAELKVQSSGVLTAGGIAAFLLGSLMLANPAAEPYIAISLKLIASATAFTALFFLAILLLVLRAMRRKPVTGAEGMVGMVGVARSELSPEGYVHVHGELWRAVARQGSIGKGRKVKVVGVRDLTLEVEEVKE